MGTTVAAYARVSTERQAEAQTIDQQVDRLRAYAAAQDWPLDDGHLYQDAGYSGAQLNRPALDRVRDAVARGEVDVLLVTSPDRLARRYAYQVWLLEGFERAGCQVVFLDRPPSGDPQETLLVQIRGAVAEYERTLIADRMRRGCLAKLRSGRLLPWTRAPYGYRLDPRRPRDPAGVQVDETVAAVVRRLFTWYAVDGLTLRAIARRLTEEHVPSPSGRDRWNTSSVRKLLTNHAYRGTAYGNQLAAVPARRRRPLVKPAAPEGAGRSGRRRPPEEWIGVAVPALVADELFAQAQARLARNRDWSPRNTRADYLLRRLVSCGRCGLAHRIWTNGRAAFYTCPGTAADRTRGRPTVCRAPRIATHRLDAAVWDDICRLLTDPAVLTESLRRARQGWLGEGSAGGRWQALGRREAELRRQIERLVDAYAAGALPLDELQARRTRLETRLIEVRREADALAAAAQRDERLEAIAAQLDGFRAALACGLDTADFARRRTIVELLVDRVLVDAPDVEIRYILPLDGAVSLGGGLGAHHSADVGRIHAVMDDPVLRWSPLHARMLAEAAVRMRAIAAIDEGARVGGIAQDVVQRCFGGLLPLHPAQLFGGGLHAWHPQALIAKAAQHLLAAAELGEARRHEANGALDAQVGVLDHSAIREPHQPGGQTLPIRAPLHLAQPPSIQAQAQQVQLGFAEHPAQAQEQPVVVAAGVVDAVGISDQRANDRGEVEQRVPVGIRARQAAHLIGEDDPDPPQRHLGHQFLEPAPRPILAGLAEVGIDHVDPLPIPSQRHGPVDEGVLITLALPVVVDLLDRGLAHIHVRAALVVAGGDLGGRLRHHTAPPAARAAGSAESEPGAPETGPARPERVTASALARSRRWWLGRCVQGEVRPAETASGA
jgi:site-specific DNA recombinase